MKIYLAICEEPNPESEGYEIATNILGVFSTAEAADAAFTKEEQRQDKDGHSWKSKHGCFRGRHQVKTLELDQQYSMGG